jgi:predicted  nucleic acid-binding Zn-ribbon protein
VHSQESAKDILQKQKDKNNKELSDLKEKLNKLQEDIKANNNAGIIKLRMALTACAVFIPLITLGLV